MDRAALRRLGLGAVVTVLSVITIAQPAFGRTASRVNSGVPLTMRVFCETEHVSCAGHWTKLGGRRTYQLSTAIQLKASAATSDRPACSPCLGPGPIQNSSTGHCISSNGGGNGTHVGLYGCNGSNNQKWWVDGGTTSYGGYVFYNVADGLCLNNANGSLSNGNYQQMWSCYNSENESYTWNEDGYDPPFGFVHPVASSLWCLSSYGNSGANAPVYLYYCNGSTNQDWYGPFG